MASNKQSPMKPEFVDVDVPTDEAEYDSEETIIEEPISKYRPRDAATTSLVGPKCSPKASVVQKQSDWMPENWRKEVVQRVSGLSKGRCDNYYISPTGERFRSRKEVERYLKEQVRAETTSQAVKQVENTTGKKRRGRPRKYGALSSSNPAHSPLKKTFDDGDGPALAKALDKALSNYID